MTMPLMSAYSAYIAMVFLTVAAPGPGQLMTIQNATAQGLGAAMFGVAGLCLGTVLMSSLSVLGVGGLLQSLPEALWGMKLAGACYLMYLAWKAWRSARLPVATQALSACEPRDSPGILVRRGFLLQTVNPKPIFFFLAVLPPLALDTRDGSFSLLRAFAAISVYLCALWVIHGGLALVVTRRRRAVASHRSARWLQRGSALCFAGFALLLLLR